MACVKNFLTFLRRYSKQKTKRKTYYYFYNVCYNAPEKYIAPIGFFVIEVLITKTGFVKKLNFQKTKTTFILVLNSSNSNYHFLIHNWVYY